MPSLPSIPSTPSVPSRPSSPSLPSVPSVPSLPSVPSVPGSPCGPCSPCGPAAPRSPLNCFRRSGDKSAALSVPFEMSADVRDPSLTWEPVMSLLTAPPAAVAVTRTSARTATAARPLPSVGRIRRIAPGYVAFAKSSTPDRGTRSQADRERRDEQHRYRDHSECYPQARALRDPADDRRRDEEREP